ncbi:hypothetical protein CN558_04505 [Bacillus wiedmannii]|uniref:hypothetical protein n=1 Tax=Bacillus wiedmannii TaxID=1890302 RepID=UPI000BF05EC8|nr:hypothetical protein [Bacillus wiedmannii]PEO88240.1 hypothetical protein CN558_04505 [Bacillus wiedmannii]
MSEKYFCKECNHYVSGEEFYHQGKVCKKCRNEKSNNKIKNLTDIELAEHLLQRSCMRVLERVRGDKKEAYKGVKCDWKKPSEMKRDLMNNNEFWGKWVEQSRIYEESGKSSNLRPTIDRVESDVKKGGHYTMGNLQVLSHGENTFKAKSVKCKVIFIKDLKVVRITDYESMKDVMKELNIPAYSTINLFKDSGKIHNIGNGYSILIQTPDGVLKKQDSVLYKSVFTKRKILIDYVTGKEYIISDEQYSFDSYGIWFNESQVIAQ